MYSSFVFCVFCVFCVNQQMLICLTKMVNIANIILVFGGFWWFSPQ